MIRGGFGDPRRAGIPFPGPGPSPATGTILVPVPDPMKTRGGESPPQSGRGPDGDGFSPPRWQPYMRESNFEWLREGHGREERVAIFADTRAEWFMVLQACFRRNVTVVTIYSSLGEEALCHSLNESLQDTVARFTSMDYTTTEFSGSEDGNHIFEAIGLLIGMEDVPLEKQADYLSSLLTPLCHQVEILLMNAKVLSSEESPAKIVIIQQIIIAINALSKSDNVNICPLERLGPSDGHTHFSNRVMGTHGYIDPSYAMTGRLYVESDVYSFGVVLLELMTGLMAADGKRPAGQVNLVGWLKPILSKKSELENIMDSTMESQCY